MGDFYEEQSIAQDGKWVYENKNIFVEKNDVIHYWMNIVHNGINYNVSQKQFLVNDLIRHMSKRATRPTLKPLTTNNNNIKRTLVTYTPDCKLSQTIVKGEKVCQGVLIFEDNFNTNSLWQWKREIKMPLDTEVSIYWMVY